MRTGDFGRARRKGAGMKWSVVIVACLGVLGVGGCQCTPPRSGTSTVSGTVFLDGLCEPAAGASVSVLDGGLATVTDADGRYQLAGVPQGAVFRLTGPG